MLTPNYRTARNRLNDFAFRMRWAVVVMIIMSFFLVCRLFYLQVIKTDYFQVKAEENRINVSPIAPNRGLIFDRNGNVLARNYSSYALEFLPYGVDNPELILANLSRLISITDEEKIRIRAAMADTGRFSNVIIRDDLTEGEIALFTSNAYRFPDVKLSAQLYREYPYGELTSHLLGYVRRISKSDLRVLEDRGLRAGYTNSDWIGKRGIEAFYESVLRGQLGLRHVEVDARGTELRLLDRQNAISGKSLTLSIDIGLQRQAFEALGDHNGALVALNPNDGSILAFVSKPGYDPSKFVLGFDQASWSELRNSPDRPLVNRASSGVYPPGSTLKPFLALAGLEENVRSPDWSMWDPGFFSIPGSKHKFRDWKKEGHGQVNLHKAIVESVDTYFYKLAHELEIDKIHTYLTLFGFGQKTGIDLPTESIGIAPSRDWKRKRFKAPWYPGDTISVGIGQGYNLVTPLQLAVATASIANGGFVLRPTFLRKETVERTQKGLTRANATSSRPLNLSSKNLDTLRTAMEGVMRAGGTAARAGAGASYTIAGKTGTAQVFSLRGGEYDEDSIQKRLQDHALFVAYAPAEDPSIALAVVVENGGGGGSVAAPIARKVLDAYFKSTLLGAPSE